MCGGEGISRRYRDRHREIEGMEGVATAWPLASYLPLLCVEHYISFFSISFQTFFKTPPL